MAVAVGLYTRLPGACRRATGRGGTGGCGAAARVFHGDRRTPGADRQFTGRFRVGNSDARVRFAAAADAANVARSVRRRAVGRRPDHGNPGDPEPRFQKRADPVGQRRYVSRQPGRLVLLHSLQPALRLRLADAAAPRRGLCLLFLSADPARRAGASGLLFAQRRQTHRRAQSLHLPARIRVASQARLPSDPAGGQSFGPAAAFGR